MSEVKGITRMPSNASALYVLAHGAGAGMTHPFMEASAKVLEKVGVGTFRYEFPSMAAGKRRPDSPRVAQASVRAAVSAAHAIAGEVPLIAGGKSFGGRMTSMAQSQEKLADVRGLVFLGFPLHAPGKLGDERARHLDDITIPMLFIQGTRDSLADLSLISGVCKRLGKRATLHVVDGGDHSFNVLKRSGRDAADVMGEIATAVSAWVSKAL